MLTVLKNLLLSPRLWLSAGVLCLGTSILLGYHQDQMDAEDALAKKILMPERVVIQDFSGDANENEMNEISVLTEAGLDKTVRIDVAREGVTRLVDVVPIYPVSRQSLPIVRSLGIAKRSPVARSQAAAIAERNSMLARVENVPVGLMVFEANASSNPPTLENMQIGVGINGPLIELIGVHIEGTAILEKAAAPLDQSGVMLIDEALVVSPYMEGRLSGLPSSDYSDLRRALFWASAMMLAVGLATMFSLPSLKKNNQKASANNEVKAVGAFPAVDPFQPIAAQDEIGGEPEETKARKTSCIISIASNVFRTKSRP